MRETTSSRPRPVDRLAVGAPTSCLGIPIPLREACCVNIIAGGQSFIVVPAHSRPSRHFEGFSQENMPRIDIWSSRMTNGPSDRGRRMSAFYDRKYDVLLSTTIVERRRLDIPSATRCPFTAPTVRASPSSISSEAVSDVQKRAHILYVTLRNRIITEKGREKLKILGDLDRLGAGFFELASHDLDIAVRQLAGGRTIGGHIQGSRFRTLPMDAEDAILEAKAKALACQPEHGQFLPPEHASMLRSLIPGLYVLNLSLRKAFIRRIERPQKRCRRSIFLCCGND